MRLGTVRLRGYRCFGEETEVSLGNITALVGTNGVGKSAILRALSCLFGLTQAERTLQKDDFHLAPGQDPDTVAELTLRIEAVLEFPELEDGGDAVTAVAACFRQMTIAGGPRARPYCRIRLDAKWQRSSLPEGEVEQSLSWVTSAEGASKETTCGVLPVDRARIHVHYIPAVRDPLRQIRKVSGSILHRLLQAIEWSEAAREAAATASNAVKEVFGREAGLATVEAAIQGCWNEVYGQPQHLNVSVRPIARRFEDMLRQVEASFEPSVADSEGGIERLSDGQKSLFYLALVAAVFDVESSLDAESTDIDRNKLEPPVLTIFAVEEPENHVVPHFLGRIMRMYRRIAGTTSGQVVLTSHSPSILARVDPGEVRYLRLLVEKRASYVSEIKLPADSHLQAKYVRGAVRAHPELYFARCVVLGEGDSEAVVLPRVANALSVPLDESLVSFAPLGGRHVHHFWRLLTDLEIPCFTLLDLDRDRTGGGWGRIKYALEQLLELGLFDEQAILPLTRTAAPGHLTRRELAKMHTWTLSSQADTNSMQIWMSHLESFGVYFSEPLDLDFMMMRRLPSEYEATAEGVVPAIPTDGIAYEAELADVLAAVFKKSATAGATYDEEERRALFWYRHLFLARGKPSTHMLALEGVTDTELKQAAPAVLTRLFSAVSTELRKYAATARDAP